MTTTKARLPLDWTNVSFIGGTHLIALLGLPAYLMWHGLSTTAVVLFFAFAVLTIFSISAGYHRLFSHVTYEAHPALRLFLLLFGAATFQNSALKWSIDHRRHHKRVDTDDDPYNIRQGFWHAHILWVLYKDDPNVKQTPALDLERDPLVLWQARHCFLIGFLVGIVLPLALGFAAGDPWGGLLVAGVFRVVAVHHITFSINSVAHYLGTQPYSDDDSSRDSFITALVSMGEGYHNFHHTFPSDYRNGVRLHQFDPTKWILRVLAWTGIARNLRKTPRRRILEARIEMDRRRFERRFGGRVPPQLKDRIETLRGLVQERLDRLHALHTRWTELKASAGHESRRLLANVREDMRVARRDFRGAWGQWKQLLARTRLPVDV